jgi:hypothetical protein
VRRPVRTHGNGRKENRSSVPVFFYSLTLALGRSAFTAPPLGAVDSPGRETYRSATTEADMPNVARNLAAVGIALWLIFFPLVGIGALLLWIFS